VDSGERDDATMGRDAALARVLTYRERGRARPTLVRVSLAVLAGILLLACVPLMVLLPEAGVPLLLVGFRLLAVEVDWAARAYAWTDWRVTQLRDWFDRQSGFTRASILAGLLLVVVALVWWIVVQFV
jgi:hypothetical protein